MWRTAAPLGVKGDVETAARFLKKWRLENLPEGMTTSDQGNNSQLWQTAQTTSSNTLRRLLGGDANFYINRTISDLETLKRIIPDLTRDPLNYWLTTTNCSLIEHSAKQLRGNFPFILIDVCGSNLNAHALRVEGKNQYALLFSAGFRTFTELITDVIGASWMLLPQQLLRSPNYFAAHHILKNRPDLSEQFARILLATIIKNDVSIARHGMTPTQLHPFTLKLLMCTEFFVAAHEIAHITEGHLSGRAAPDAGIHVFSTADGKELTIPAATRARWNEECEADRIALELLFQLCRTLNIELDIGYAGAEICVSAAEALDRANWIIRDGSIDRPASASHPPPYLRRDMLRKVLPSVWPDFVSADKRLDYTEQLRAVGQLLQYVIEVLFDSGALRYCQMEHLKSSGAFTQ